MHNQLNLRNLLILSCLIFDVVSITSTAFAADSSSAARREELQIKKLFNYGRKVEIPIKLKVKVMKSDQTFSLVYANNDILLAELLNLENKSGADLFSLHEGIRSDYSSVIGSTKSFKANYFLDRKFGLTFLN